MMGVFGQALKRSPSDPSGEEGLCADQRVRGEKGEPGVGSVCVIVHWIPRILLSEDILL